MHIHAIFWIGQSFLVALLKWIEWFCCWKSIIFENHYSLQSSHRASHNKLDKIICLWKIEICKLELVWSLPYKTEMVAFMKMYGESPSFKSWFCVMPPAKEGPDTWLREYPHMTSDDLGPFLTYLPTLNRLITT